MKSTCGHFEKWDKEKSYITYDMDFRLVHCDPVYFDKL